MEWPGAQFTDPNAPNYLEVDFALRSGDKIADKAKLKAKDQSKPRSQEAFRGYFVLISRGQYPPGLSAIINGRIVDFPQNGPERTASEPYFYGGVEVLVQVQLKAYQVGDNKPVVTAYPNVVLSLNKGEKVPEFSGGTAKSGAAAFASYTGHVSTVDPTVGLAI
jgi:hypothetical protein